jgi:RimJ/RimL family protein N-acetyltransferase
MVHYAFSEYDLARIEARVFGWNPASRRVLEKAGFMQEGTIRNGVFKDNRLTDEFIYGILKEEWQKNVKNSKRFD